MRNSTTIEVPDVISHFNYSPFFKRIEKEKPFIKKDLFVIRKFLKLAEKHAQKGGPKDLSLAHDKYLYGR